VRFAEKRGGPVALMPPGLFSLPPKTTTITFVAGGYPRDTLS